MGSWLLRIGWIVMLILGVYWIGCGVYTMTGGASMTESEFELTTDQSWEAFVAANPDATVDFIVENIRISGVDQLAIGALVVMVAIFAYRRGQKWSWYSLLAVGIIYWVGWLIFLITVAGTIYWVIIGLVLLVIALALPAKDILTQKSS